ncbi:DNA primase large subunit [Citrus sinensis]|uniref:DNA primase large subunit n=1 Tax=Citrus sinensis TaxID=2711 RepID=A0ACB8LGP1_CITSI|nr:DNA primase large subunit [Citrus sinensis]
MEIVRSQRSRTNTPNDSVSTLPLYRYAPQLEVRLEDFEVFAMDRLRVLKGISDALARGKRPEEMENLVRDLWKANMRHPEASEDVNKDIISHFVLRLVYCRTEDLRKWFLSMETALYRYRFLLGSSEAKRALMEEFDLPCKAISRTEFENAKEKLEQVARSFDQPLPTADAIFYKVPFEEVPELVAGRRVYIHKGHAYVAMHQVVSLVVTQFRSNLSKALILTNRKWTSTIREQEKDRLTPIVEALSMSYLGPDYSQTKEFGEISIKDLDQLARSSFPLCMRHLFDKYVFRRLFTFLLSLTLCVSLYAKGVGLRMEDALAFWKAEFSHKVGAERFDKEYAYSIRHNYGKEGKRTIRSETNGVHVTSYGLYTLFLSKDHFLDSCEENLRAALGRMGVGSRAMEDVVDKVRNRHYQLACTLTFEAVHSSSCDAGINHPNQYFSDSHKILQPKSKITNIQVQIVGQPHSDQAEMAKFRPSNLQTCKS